MAERIDKVLEPFISALNADGYGARVEESDGEIIFEISSGPEACAECLSPRSVLEPMIERILSEHGIIGSLRLRYPPSHGEA